MDRYTRANLEIIICMGMVFTNGQMAGSTMVVGRITKWMTNAVLFHGQMGEFT